MEMARRHRSLPFSPLDAGAGSQRLPLTPLHAAKLNVPHLEASELGTMDVWTMRQLIHTAGLKHADCEDIDALRERARQALAGDQYIAGERQLERDAEEDETPELPECFDENNNGSLELRRTSMRSSTDGLQPASHRRARISAPNATPCIQHCSHRDRESDSDSAEHSERELKWPRLSPRSLAQPVPPTARQWTRPRVSISAVCSKPRHPQLTTAATPPSLWTCCPRGCRNS